MVVLAAAVRVITSTYSLLLPAILSCLIVIVNVVLVVVEHQIDLCASQKAENTSLISRTAVLFTLTLFLCFVPFLLFSCCSVGRKTVFVGK